ncbi:MAG TPA: hypothetical protein PLP19_15845 [bacterium]|nr:hypothetical protein [bacterium]HPN44965.1 hypothetical protein [bacterium]
MRFFVIIITLIGILTPLYGQAIDEENKLEVSSGISMMLYQSVFSFQTSSAVETACRGTISGLWDWQAGARLGFNPALGEGFVRILAAPQYGFWRPLMGFEFGVTNRAHFKEGNKLLRETTQAMEGDISHFYIAGHSAPLSFKLGEQWRMSLFEIHIGTQLGHTGRSTRVQLGIISVGRSL